ncbi:DUF397 domain-containing protein [Streptomonospora wellingtoniae]|uniref:DUF397 domain-containing protein n=1 Tax=Streptomonospora wellingtoniae TaxID=3075544 RepID=A0ABU2KR95_9ACTN|nr:DUF397 domain-containing protein [Streptomonospora sp. DSM 45055]MDT0301797.1 DUF397 domain-containing protein [Streptomonospora sp. DSM 45055]
MTTERLAFFKSSYSSDRVDCVEVARTPASFRSGRVPDCLDVADLPAGAAMRGSKHPEAGHLSFPAAEWDAFLTAARAAAAASSVSAIRCAAPGLRAAV